MRIVFTGGGTGGHLFPIIAVAREIQKLYRSSLAQGSAMPETPEMLFVGPATVGDEIFEKEGIVKKTILAGKMRRYASGQNLLDVFRLGIGLAQALWILFVYMPNVVFSKGGYGSVPVVLAAWIYRIPVLIHESDAQPGLANKIMAKFSQRIAISFSQATDFFPAKKTALVGNPIREAILAGTKEKAKTTFGLTGQKPVLFILGGSQGAKAINDAVLIVLFELAKKYEIIHQCGPDNFEEISTILENNLPLGYCLFPFLDEEQMAQAFTLADLVISRAGAGSIFEIAACGKPSILIPLPNAAADHQKLNAYSYAKTGATLVLAQENLTPNFLKNRIGALLENPDLLAKMSTAAKSFARLDAAPKIAEEILGIAKQ